MSTFPWIAHYPKGVPAEIEDQRPKNLLELYQNAFNQFGSREAFENMGGVLTFQEVDQLSTNFAAYLQNELGMVKGDRIAIQMPNCLQYPVVLIGAIKAGCTVVNTNPLYTHREMEHQFNDAGIKAIVIMANFAKSLEEAMPNLSVENIIVTELGDMLGGLKGKIVNFVVKHIKKMVPAFKLPNTTSFKSAMAKGARMKYTKPEIESDDIAFLQYTGGTTGVSKGAMLSHDNVVAHTLIITRVFTPLLKKGQKDIMITAIPLYHIFALNVNCTFMMHIGAKNVLITNPRDMPGFVKELKKHPFTLFTGVNTLFNGLLNQPNFKEIDFTHLKVSIGGGMAVQDFVANKWQEVTGTPLVQGYGLSETSPVICVNPLDGTHKMGSIGLPVPSTELAIFDDEGNRLAQGETGEICVKGPQVMSGYWNKDNEGVFFEGGYFKTGDIGIMDEEGFFKIVDRKKDMINVSGFNVYPNDVENAIADHPKVLEVAVIGVPDPHSTECVKAFIVKSDPSLTEEELRDYCHENLTGYKRPKHYEFRTELPKSNVGKILRRKLKEEEEANT
ncbi:long-chain acyl-CoA synthetase [Roseivirga ehrenbergii]|uniref:Long-chain-fatty-acid--CoA ligase n=1 Tax=Roseivirga ehrenbergii (strain DSM 102268 / JCM 13514 / KCTC 12282 / NCIMB 14502 / KMM 6017) TaxID=279360 RepID=A0A150WXZ0_ROSEK|nr:AMP-binding protein [Roseivirga ehrenbergii]KYG71361.1 long-chain fatty acid--CoA ligase [Roseivirga ehrenbergii]TCK99594.1 long-chain acyl-CoA synthetase [Roseivirga ehrenbergii]